MGKKKVEPLITSFTPAGDYFGILCVDRFVRVWNTSTGTLFAEWNDPEGGMIENYSCMGCSFIGKKRKKEDRTFIVALATHSGDVFAINVLNGDQMWMSNACLPSGARALSFSKNGRILYAADADGLVSELDTATGEPISKFKASKKQICSLSVSLNEKFLVVASDKVHVFSLETKKELLKLPCHPVCANDMAVSDSGKFVVSASNDQLEVWTVDQNAKTESMVSLSMRGQPLILECRDSGISEDGVVVLSVSEKGVAYVWNLRSLLEEDVNPSKIHVKTRRILDQQNSPKKVDIPIIAARIHKLEDGVVSVLIIYGSSVHLHFDVVEITSPGKRVWVTAPEDALIAQENVESRLNGSSKSPDMKSSTKKRPADDSDIESPRSNLDSSHLKLKDGSDIDYNDDEPTMGERLTSLNIHDEDKKESPEKLLEPHQDPIPPSADSVQVLLKQALHADDHALLLDCLYAQDEKVITNSIIQLNPSDVLKLLNSLLSLVQTRGAVMVCAIPWLRSLLLQHASGLMSQESSLRALNSLYQLIESRLSTFKSTLQLTSCLDYLFTGATGDVTDDEQSAMPPVIYEDEDDSDDGESVDAMETDGGEVIQENEADEFDDT